MKKLLHKLGMWVMRLLNGCPDEMLNDAISIAERDIKSGNGQSHTIKM